MKLDFSALTEPRPISTARVSVPVPFMGQAVGAGELVHKLTDWLGIEQCEPCKKREEQLNRLMSFRPMNGVTVRWND